MTIYSGTVNYGVVIGPRDRIEPGTSFASSVAVSDCPAFVSFPDGTSFASSVAVSDCPAFVSFPDGTSFASWVAVSDCPAFVSFPDGTSFASSVEVRNCPAFVGAVGCTYRGHAIAFGDLADERIADVARAVAANPAALKMANWHCGTSHCLAGWGTHQQGEAGYSLERQFKADGDSAPEAAAGLVFLGLEAAGWFYKTDDDQAVRNWLASKLADYEAKTATGAK